MASIVVIEHDRAFLGLLQEDLVAAGHEVAAFAEWPQVLDLFDTDYAVDAFVTALCVPAGAPNGHALAQMARARRSQLKVVYVNVAAERSELQDFLPGVLVNSTRPCDVVDAVSRALAA